MSEMQQAAKEAAKKKGIDWQDEWDDQLAAIEGDVNEWWDDRPHKDFIDYRKEVSAK